MSSDHHRVSRLIRMASEIKTNPQQEPPALLRALGISKPQFYKDKRALVVLQWGEEDEVLEPKSLRRELQETAERLLTLYGKMK